MKFGVLLMIGLIAGCTSHDVIIDTKGVNERQYQQDLAECQVYTGQINTVAEVAENGAVGAAVGGAIGAIVGNRRTAEKIAGVGAVTGSVKGGSRAEHRKQDVLRNCLRGRGYKVLG
jgi:outer membrane lipoprotein SlyB